MTLLKLFRAFSWLRIENREEVFPDILTFFPDLDGDDLRIRELILKSFNYWLTFEKKHTSLVRLSGREVKGLGQVLKMMKINVNDSFLIKTFTKSKDTRSLLYLVLSGTREGGPALNDLLKIFGRSRIIRFLEIAEASSSVREIEWSRIKSVLEQ